MKRWICVLCAVLFLFPSVCHAFRETTVTAEGMAAGSDLKARDEALNRALRAAVERGVGSVIDTESMTKNYQLLEDRIYSQVKGYVTGYDIISDNGGADGIYKISIKATVALASLEKDIRALNIIRERKGNPRVMALIQDFIDGLEQPGELAQAEMEKEFLRRGFPLIDEEQARMIKDRDVALSYADPQKAAALGREFGAEIVIVGQAVCSLLESSSPYGVQVFAYSADITARAIKTDTAEVIAIGSAQATERGSGRIPTANKALSSAGKQISGSMMNDVIEKWRSEVFNTVNMQVVINNVSPGKREVLKDSIGALRGVQGVHERSFGGGVLFLDLTVEGPARQAVEQRLLELPDTRLRLVSRTDNRIDLKCEDM